jgi:hypothetical protein
MLIAAISSSSAPVLLNPVLTARPRIHEIASLPDTTSGSSAAVAPSPANSSNTGTSSPGPHSGVARAQGGGSGAGGAAATAASAVETLVGSYTTTVGGTQYAGSVEEQNGSYVASVPNLGGATATGASMIEAENNLTTRIDELV